MRTAFPAASPSGRSWSSHGGSDDVDFCVHRLPVAVLHLGRRPERDDLGPLRGMRSDTGVLELSAPPDRTARRPQRNAHTGSARHVPAWHRYVPERSAVAARAFPPALDPAGLHPFPAVPQGRAAGCAARENGVSDFHKNSAPRPLPRGEFDTLPFSSIFANFKLLTGAAFRTPAEMVLDDGAPPPVRRFQPRPSVSGASQTGDAQGISSPIDPAKSGGGTHPCNPFGSVKFSFRRCFFLARVIGRSVEPLR